MSSVEFAKKMEVIDTNLCNLYVKKVGNFWFLRSSQDQNKKERQLKRYLHYGAGVEGKNLNQNNCQIYINEWLVDLDPSFKKDQQERMTQAALKNSRQAHKLVYEERDNLKVGLAAGIPSIAVLAAGGGTTL